MENLKQTNENPIDLALFQVEELEERMENCWMGHKHVPVEEFNHELGIVETEYVKVPC